MDMICIYLCRFIILGAEWSQKNRIFCVSAQELHQQSALGTSPSQNPKSKIQLLAVLTLNLGAPFTTPCPRQNIPNVNFSGSENKHFPLQEHLNPFQSLNSERRGRREWRVWFVQRCQILLLGKEKNPLLQKKPFAKTSPNFTAQNTPGWVCWKSREEWISFLSSEQNSAWFSCLVPFFPLWNFYSPLWVSPRNFSPSRVASPELLVFMSVNRISKAS